MAERYDVVVVGCGLIGLATAKLLIENRPGVSILLVDKEERVAVHQSGNSSGVIHSGLYYRPGSVKARLCVEGAREMYEFCESEGVAHRRSGKLVIATGASQVPALDELLRRGTANGLSGLRRLGPEEIKEVEPAATGIDALHVPEAGVTDFAEVAGRLKALAIREGATLRLGHAVTEINRHVDRVEVGVGEERVVARALVNCAGLHSDRVAAMDGVHGDTRIVPFRGEYYRLESRDLVRSLIYPVPDPRFPFLGVHFTRRVGGDVEVGPNAVLAMAREQYRGVGPDLKDIGSMLRWVGFWRMAGRNIGPGFREIVNSRSRGRYARLVRALVPAVDKDDLRPGGAGVRAQAVDRAGRIVDDFSMITTERTVHVLNAPSPGGTSSLAFGRWVSDRVLPMLAPPGRI